MATATPILLAEYLQTSFQPDREWVEGELNVRHAGEFSLSSAEAFLVVNFGNHGKTLGLRVYSELKTRVAERAYRVPGDA